jgi:transcriptional regulator with XRE-family HTH domain
MGNRGTSSVDVHVGRRVHTARLAKGLSQTALGSALGLSFQQIQKYENGINRIGTGRLHELVEILEVPLAYFFEGLETDSKKLGPNIEMIAIATALSTAEGVRIAIALSAIENPALRRGIAALLEEIIANQIPAGGPVTRARSRGRTGD